MADLKEMADSLIKGKAPQVKELVKKALDEGVGVEKILDEGILKAVDGVSFKIEKEISPHHYVSCHFAKELSLQGIAV